MIIYYLQYINLCSNKRKIIVSDDESAAVHGIITKDGLFDGTVSTAVDDYHIEPLSRYIKPNGTTHPFHTIVYKTSNVQDPRKNLPCASHLLHIDRLVADNKFVNQQKTYSKKRSKRWLLQAEAKLPYDAPTGFWHPNRTRHLFSPTFDLNQPIDEELDLVINNNRTNVDLSSLIFRNVNKRATIDPKKTTCMLYLQADHQFFQKYGTEEACIEVMTRHVQRVNSIYKSTGKDVAQCLNVAYSNIFVCCKMRC